MPSLALQRREILQRVATGELTPEEAAELLAGLDTAGADAERPAADQAAPADHAARAEPSTGTSAASDRAGTTPPRIGLVDPGGTEPITSVHVRSACRAVTIVADRNVQSAVAEGDHTATVDGGVLTIEALLDRAKGFSFVRAAGSPGLRARARVRLGADMIRPLVVRMHPDLALEAHVDAGSVAINGVHGPIRAVASAGAVRIDDFDGPIELRVAAGSASARGRLAHGASRIECDAGKVSLRLSPDSSVRIQGQVTLGQLSAPDVVGDGAATLNVTANLGSVEVSVDGDDGPDGVEDFA